MPDWNELASATAEWLRGLPLLVRFLVGLSLFTFIPTLSRRVKLPGVVGLILAGILFGKSGLHLWPEDTPVIELFAEVGKLLVLFYAGLSVDVDKFKARISRAVVFGLATLLLPLGAGAAAGLFFFGYDVNAALLIGSLIASHTLLGFPIVQRLGLAERESVMVVTAATILTDVVSLLILAVCVSIHTTGFEATTLVVQVGQVVLYAFVVVVVIDWLARRLFARSTGELDAGLLHLLIIVTVASLLAQAINLEPIVGAFLSGLAASRAMKDSEVRSHIESLGNSLFLPAFYITIGLRMEARAALRSLIDDWQVVLALGASLVGGKFVAAWLGGWFARYPLVERLNMWSLTLPQVASTIAATLVAYETVDDRGRRLIEEPILNTVFVLVLVTATLGPILTEHYSRRMVEVTGSEPAAT